MRDALTASELIFLRTRPQSTELKLAVHKPASIFTARVNEPSTLVWPMFEVDFDAGSPTSGAIIKEGMTLYVGSTAGARDRGEVRVRADLTAAATGTIKIAELGQYRIDIQDNDFLTVVENFPVAAKFPRFASGVWNMDYDITYTDENVDYGPIARLGCSAIGYLEDGACVLKYVGERSAAYSPSDSIGTFAWVFPSAATPTPATSSSEGTAASPVSVSYAAAVPGGRYHSFEVTETTSSKTHKGWRLTFVFERTGSNAPYSAILIQSITGGVEAGGYRTTVRVINTTADQDDFPDGAHVVLFEEAHYGDYWYFDQVAGTFTNGEVVTGGASSATGTITGTTSPFQIATTSGKFESGEVVTGGTSSATGRIASPNVGGNFPHRTNIVLEGWIVDETVRKNPDTGEIEFEVATVDEVMRNAKSYPVALTNQTSATISEWDNFRSLTLDRGFHHFVKWRSTLSNVVDCTFYNDIVNSSPTNAETVKYLDFADGTLWDQILPWFSGTMRGWIASDMQSALYPELDAQIDDTTRAAIATAFTMADGDKIGVLEIGRRAHRKRNAQVTIYGVQFETPRGSRSPDDPYAYQGLLEEITEGLVAPDQSTFNTWAGNLSAKLNNEYPAPIHNFQGNWRLEVIPQAFVVESLVAGDTIRGFTWTAVNFLPRDLTLEYLVNSQRFMSTSALEAQTTGQGGASITFPTPSDPPAIPSPPPIGPGDPAIDSDASELWFLRSNVSSVPQGVVWSGNFFAGGQPDWNESAVPANLTTAAARPHFFDISLDGTNAYLISYDTVSRVWHTSDPRSSSPTWTNILSVGDTIESANVDAIGRPFLYGSKALIMIDQPAGVRLYGEYDPASATFIWIVTGLTGAVTVRDEAPYTRAHTEKLSGTATLFAAGGASIASIASTFTGPYFGWQNLIGGDRLMFRKTSGPTVHYVHNFDTAADLVSGFNLPAVMGNASFKPMIRGSHRGLHVLFADDNGSNVGIAYRATDGATFSSGTTWLPGVIETGGLNGSDTLAWVPFTTTVNQEMARISTDGGSSWTAMTGDFWTNIQTSGSFFSLNMRLVFKAL